MKGAVDLLHDPRAKHYVRQILHWHIPVTGVSRPLFHTLYRAHVSGRAVAGWLLRLVWYEPLFRSQCGRVGRNFRMEQLPYIYGKGFIEIGHDVCLSGKQHITFSHRFTASPRLTIGDGTFLGHDSVMTIADHITIGRRCLIAGSVRITDFDGHSLRAGDRRREEWGATPQVAPVIIEDDVWVAHGAVILKGVRLGHGSVVGARAVVTKDVPPYAVVAGNPARVVKLLEEDAR